MPFVVVGFGLGVLAHVAFNRLEPRRVGPILGLLCVPPALLFLAVYNTHGGVALSLPLCCAVYLTGLTLSTVAYRLSPFHPLAKFPGPVICKITRLWAFWVVWKGRQHVYYKRLHERYGTHVRTGPNHLLVSDAAAIQTVLGSKGFPRGPRYETSQLPGSTGHLIGLTNIQEHAIRRRRWDRSLNTTAILGYQDALEKRVKQLVCGFEQKGQGGRGVNLNSWLFSFSFDFMGDLAFGGAFKLMEQGHDVDGHVATSRLGVRHQELIGTIPWIDHFQPLFYWADNLRRFRQFAKDSVLARKARGSKRKDIFFYLLDEEGAGPGPLPLPTLILESSLAIVAGSDTTGTALSNLFFNIIAQPAVFARLCAEVDATFPPGADVFVPSLLGGMKYLNAVINETLRLYPAVPNGVQRVIRKERGGAVVAGRWVPASTNIQVPTYTLHRDKRYFSPDPESFRPERWLGEEGFHTDPAAFFPFSHGPMNCAGKYLALQELRMVVCSLLQKFEFEFVKGWDPAEWERAQRDIFVLSVGQMPVIVRARS